MKILLSVERIIKAIIFILIMTIAGIILVLEPRYICKETANYFVIFLMNVIMLHVFSLFAVMFRLEYIKLKDDEKVWGA